MMVADTCFCIDLMRERKKGVTGPALTKLIDLGDAELYISMFTLCELRAGAELSSRPKKELERIEKMLDYVSVIYPDTAFPVFYGEAEAFLRARGNPIPVMDLLIGVTAKASGMPLLTKDIKHYEMIPGLVVESY